ncbi:hypothetical protein N657DRAFT_651315 [Parathielavia appendiculata]|uniref:Uncharacterized protein n=1 Tax=Parathielavia appendiculata TaxID=2587402 RepID=A0AAN6YY36_9PEZI|nr:hypothetical protein N657DRAFT_651315 [Parathielavia appendiculata]
MFTPRFPARAISTARNARLLRATREARRFQSTRAGPTSSSHFAAGVAGGVAGAGLLYGIYLMTPTGKMTRKINAVAIETNKKYQQVAATIQDKTPTTDEAIDKLKQFCYSYVAWVPGGRQYVDTAFNDLAAIRESHGEEVDRIVSETYREFQDIARTGLSLESASKAYDALANLAKKLASLSGSAADQILERHPQLNDKVGEPIKQLKQYGQQFGPEAKKLADETWAQIGDVMASGFSAESVDKVRKIVEERTQQIRKIGDDLWEKGLKQAKPYLDKNPKLRELVTKNSDILKQGNMTDLFKQIKSLGEGGDMSKLEEYVKQTVDKAKSTGSKAAGSGSMGGSSFAVLGQFLGTESDDLEKLTDAVSKHSGEAQELLEETKEDLRKLLAEKAKKAQQFAEKTKKE